MNPNRTPIIVGNWKASPPRSEVRAVTERLVQALTPLAGRDVEIVLCPPFPWLAEVAGMLANTGIALGAQTMASSDSVVTGETPPSLLRGLCLYALLGHYERRILCHERDGDVRKKVQVAFESGITPILCVGESADALEEDGGPAVVAEQLEAALDNVDLSTDLMVAYAPSWTTIGRATPPGADYANEICGLVRDTIASIASPTIAAGVRIIYGGRLSAMSIDEIAGQPEIDGVLVGSGATNAELFALLATAFATARS